MNPKPTMGTAAEMKRDLSCSRDGGLSEELMSMSVGEMADPDLDDECIRLDACLEFGVQLT